MDIEHIKWMMKDALLVSHNDNIDESLLLPLVILHDVGYAEVPKNNPFNLDLRKSHMEAGSKIAKKILHQLNYPKDKSEKIIYFISVHDNWAFGDNKVYDDNIVLAAFTDLDYLWMSTPKGFPALMKILNKTKKEMIKYLEQNDKPKLRPFATKTTKSLYENYLNDRRNESQQ